MELDLFDYITIATMTLSIGIAVYYGFKRRTI